MAEYRFGQMTRIALMGYGLTEQQIRLAESYEGLERAAARPKPSLDTQYRQRLRRESKRLASLARKL